MDPKAIGRMIKERRRTLNVRQADLAEIAEITRRTLSKIERGEANPTFETLAKILDVLGLEITIGIKGAHDQKGSRL